MVVNSAGRRRNVMMIGPTLEGIVKLVIAVAIIGLVLGLALARTELLNPKRTQVEAKIMEQKALIEAQRESIDLDTYRKEQELYLKARQQREEENLAYQRELHRATLWLLSTGGIIVALGIALGIAALGVGKAISMVIITQSIHRAQTYESRIQELRSVVRRLARANEELERELEHLRREHAALLMESQKTLLWKEVEECAA